MKHVVITGASSGFGTALARRFAQDDVRLTLLGRSESRLRDVAVPLGANYIVTDLQTSYTNVVDDVVTRFGAIDVWVNNAGVGEFDLLAAQDVAVVEEMMVLNTIAPMIICRDLVRELGSGSVIMNVCSQAAKIPTPKSAVYVGSKAGLYQFSNALRLEVKAHGIHVLTINPGPIATPFFDRADRSGKYRKEAASIMLDADRLAHTAVGACWKGKREVNAPWWMELGARMYGLTPRLFERLAKRGFEKK